MTPESGDNANRVYVGIGEVTCLVWDRLVRGLPLGLPTVHESRTRQLLSCRVDLDNVSL